MVILWKGDMANLGDDRSVCFHVQLMNSPCNFSKGPEGQEG